MEDFHPDLPCLKLGDPAPDFQVKTTFGPVRLTDYKGKWLVLFSHPGDFTPVCTTEFLAFTQEYSKFQRLNCELLGLSTDSTPSHLAWVYNIYQNTGITIPFPIIDDRGGEMARKYGMISPKTNSVATVRTVFVIDPKQIIRAFISYPMNVGRNIPEIVRLVTALQIADQYKVAMPANWTNDIAAVKPPPDTYEGLLQRVEDPVDLCCMDWYLCFCDPQRAQERT
jgi:peroxiredoxin (alkyl hydroperoxide reductase subunit C)